MSILSYLVNTFLEKNLRLCFIRSHVFSSFFTKRTFVSTPLCYSMSVSFKKLLGNVADGRTRV